MKVTPPLGIQFSCRLEWLTPRPSITAHFALPFPHNLKIHSMERALARRVQPWPRSSQVVRSKARYGPRRWLVLAYSASRALHGEVRNASATLSPFWVTQRRYSSSRLEPKGFQIRILEINRLAALILGREFGLTNSALSQSLSTRYGNVVLIFGPSGGPETKQARKRHA